MLFPSVYTKSSLTKLGLMLVLLLGRAMWVNAQSGDGQTGGASADPAQTQDTNSQTAGAVPAATGIDTTTELSENPPLTGLDEPKFQRAVVERSYLSPRAEVSESLDTNFPGSFTSTHASAVTRAVGSVDLEKLWKVHPFDLSYIAGLDAYHGGGNQLYLLQALSATQRFLWRTGQFALRDSFSYLPEGTFGFSSYGGAGGFAGGGGLGGLGGTGGLGTPGFTNNLFGSIALQPRIANMAIADVTQYLSPRGSVVLAGGYGLTDFLGTPQPSSLCAQATQCYFNSNQTTAQAGYNYQITRRDQIAVAYVFEQFHFPGITGGSINANLWQLLYGHRISGRLDFQLGGGPELVHTHEVLPYTVPSLGITIPITLSGKFLTGSARVALVYRASERTSFSASFWRFVNAGSGFFGGANTDALRFGLDRAVKRQWNLLLDGGYSRNSRLLGANAPIAGNAATYKFWYAGGAMRRPLGREFGLFISYQYNSFGFGSGYCLTTTCPNSYGRSIALIGIDWIPKPLRLD